MGRCRIAPLNDLTGASLSQFATDNVEPGAKVISDGWRGYSGLTEAGYPGALNCSLVQSSWQPRFTEAEDASVACAIARRVRQEAIRLRQTRLQSMQHDEEQLWSDLTGEYNGRDGCW